MAEPRKLDPELSEPERRDLVRRITERGSRGYQAEETTVQPSVDYAAAAEAAVRADPVVLPPSAQEELAGITGQVSEEAGRFAAAQREIFERGRQRELEAGQRYFDQGALVREAQDFALARYSEQLAEDERRRQEAARRAASAFQSFYQPPQADPGDSAPGPVAMASPGLAGPLRAVRGVDPDMVDAAYENFFARLPEDQIDDANLLTQAYDDLFEEAMDLTQDYIATGRSEAETRKLLAEGLDGAGMATYDADRMAGYIVTAYAPFWEGDFSDNPLDPFRYAPPGLEERTRPSGGYTAPVTGQAANTPRPDTYLTRGTSSMPAPAAAPSYSSPQAAMQYGPPPQARPPVSTAANRLDRKAADPVSYYTETAAEELARKYGLTLVPTAAAPAAPQPRGQMPSVPAPLAPTPPGPSALMPVASVPQEMIDAYTETAYDRLINKYGLTPPSPEAQVPSSSFTEAGRPMEMYPSLGRSIPIQRFAAPVPVPAAVPVPQIRPVAGGPFFGPGDFRNEQFSQYIPGLTPVDGLLARYQ